MDYKEKFWFNKLKENVVDTVDINDGIVDESDINTIVSQEIETMCIYDSECKEITQDLNFDVFSDDNVFNDQPRSWNHAGKIALEELWMNEADITDIIDDINFR